LIRLKVNYAKIRPMKSKKTSGEVKTLRSSTIFLLSMLYLMMIGAVFLMFGKDYLVDGGKLIFSVAVILGVVVAGFALSRLQINIMRIGTELRRTVEEEEFERNRTLTLINSIKDAVILVDDSGYISLYNAATLDMLDTNVSISRKQVSEVFHPSQTGVSFDIKKVMEELKGSKDIRFTNIKASGQPVELILTISRARSGYGKVGMRGFVLVIRQLRGGAATRSSEDLHSLRNSLAIVEGSIENAMMMISKKNNNGAIKSLESAAKSIGDVKQKTL